MSKKQQLDQPKQCGLSRRDFLKMSAATAGGAAILGGIPLANRLLAQGEAAPAYVLGDPANQINTVCLQCNTGCGIKVKMLDGVAAKIDGNPYSPWTLAPHLAYDLPIRQTAKVEGAICPKGQAGLQTAYDPYRIMRVLKRKPGTKRGEGQWVSIDFEQAIEEVVNGGDLFGEGHVDGFKDVYALRDGEVFEEMGTAVKAIWAEKDAVKKQELVEEFKHEFADHLDALIDPDHPDFGPKNNQFAFVWGRMKKGREDLVHRFMKESFGSVNMNGHTTICQGSLYFTGRAMSAKWNAATGAFDSGDKFYWQGDVANSEFVIFVGANMFEANYGPPLRVPQMTQGVVNRGMKYAVLDPRLSKAAAKAWRWVPVKPGEDGAFAMGMIRWMLEQNRYNAAYLAIANKAAAAAAGEPNYSNVSWLVKIKDGVPGKLLRASEIGLVTAVATTDSDGKEITVYETADGVRFASDVPVVLVDGQPTPFDPVKADATPVRGDLFVDKTIEGIAVKSGLQLIQESAQSHSIAEWAEIAGAREQDITTLAHEFTSHGRKAVADLHRGASQHTNGFYTILAWYTVNLLIGNFDYAGGTVKLTTYDRMGTKKGQPFDVGHMMNGENLAFGLDAIRTNVAYEKTTIFDGYPTKRPWFPLATDVYQEDVPSFGDAYPYPIKILMTYMSALAYALPAAHKVIEILADTKKIPLIISSDILVGETSTYADYIFPDLTYLERWEFHGSHPSVAYKVENVRQPAISLPGWPTTKVFGEEIPLSFEAVFLAIAEKLNLPAFGPNGFGAGTPYTRPEDFYLKQVANIAFGEKEDGSNGVPEADDEEVRLFREARRFLPKAVFDYDRWRQAVGSDEKLWRQVIYVLNRGGRYQSRTEAFKGEQVANAYGRLINVYQEKTATAINTITGKPYIGYPVYVPPALDASGEPIADIGYDFTMLTYKEITMAKARGIADYWLLAVLPENFVLMNTVDADRLGLKTDDHVKISSASNPDGVWDLQDGTKKPMIGKVRVVEGIRPGVISFPLGWGHYASGSRDITIDSQLIPADPRRATGIHANAAMRIDPVIGNVTLSDLAGGSAVFYDSKVKVEKA